MLTNATVCVYCGEPFTETNPATRDHILPVSAGGAGGGWIPACRLCNQARGACPFTEWVAACWEAHRLAWREGTVFRRPKWRQPPGEVTQARPVHPRVFACPVDGLAHDWVGDEVRYCRKCGVGRSKKALG